MFSAAYKSQVDLLVHCLPAITQVPNFALKGGTAINLFLRNMPRLSVDIDLAYLPVTQRDMALADISSGLAAIAEALRQAIANVHVRQSGSNAPKLAINSGGAHIKIEANTIIRGSLMPPVHSALCPAAQEAYEMFTEVQRLDSADLYGGKICAALDRQHPRDLFDIMHLQLAGPIPTIMRQAFVAYLAGHRRPIAEILAPKRKLIDDLFTDHFTGMAEHPVELDELEATRTQLFEWVATTLTENERRFLLLIKQGEPDWSLLPFEGLDRWPPIQWKLYNIRRMSPQAHKAALNRLRDVLGL